MVTLKNLFGVEFHFELYRFGDVYPAVSGVYAVLREVKGGYNIGYIGEAGDVRTRHANHEHHDDFVDFGATHLGVHAVLGEVKRKDIEAQLIAKYDLPINKKK